MKGINDMAVRKLQPRQDLESISIPELHQLMLETLKEILHQLKKEKDLQPLRELRDNLALLSSELERRQSQKLI